MILWITVQAATIETDMTAHSIARGTGIKLTIAKSNSRSARSPIPNPANPSWRDSALALV